MKAGDIVQVRIPNGWMEPEGVRDGQMGLLVEIKPVEYPVGCERQHDYLVLLDGTIRTLKKRLLDSVHD